MSNMNTLDFRQQVGSNASRLGNSRKAWRQLNHQSSLNIPFSFEFIFFNWLLVLRAFDNEEYFT